MELEASCVITGGLAPRDCSWTVAGRVPGCLPGLVKGPSPASSLRALAADDEGVISEPLERLGLSLFPSSPGLLSMSGTFSHYSLLPVKLLSIFYVSV